MRYEPTAMVGLGVPEGTLFLLSIETTDRRVGSRRDASFGRAF